MTSERILNSRHPITAYLRSQQEAALDEAGALEALASADFSNRRFNVHFSDLGFYSRNVDIAALKAEHRPPYRCRLPERGMVEITEELWQNSRKSKLSTGIADRSRDLFESQLIAPAENSSEWPGSVISNHSRCHLQATT